MGDVLIWYDAIEQEIISRERWQGRRAKLTLFEMEVLDAEIKSLKHPYATYIDTQIELERDNWGEWQEVEIEAIFHDMDWKVSFIQKELGSRGLSVGYHQILDMLDISIKNVFFAAEKQTRMKPVIQLPLPLFGARPKIVKAA